MTFMEWMKKYYSTETFDGLDDIKIKSLMMAAWYAGREEGFSDGEEYAKECIKVVTGMTGENNASAEFD